MRAGRKGKEKVIARSTKAGIAAAALLAMPSMATAGTSTATGAASFNVITQCSVTGATVNLGTYLTSQTWGNVAADLGLYNGNNIQGTRGQEYLTWGSVNCGAGVPYTLNIKGTGNHPWVPGGIVFAVDGVALHFNPFVKKIGGAVVPDSSGISGGFGAYVGATNSPASGIGSGAAQQVLGSVMFNAAASPQLGKALVARGVYSDTLTYTLNF